MQNFLQCRKICNEPCQRQDSTSSGGNFNRNLTLVKTERQVAFIRVGEQNSNFFSLKVRTVYRFFFFGYLVCELPSTWLPVYTQSEKLGVLWSSWNKNEAQELAAAAIKTGWIEIDTPVNGGDNKHVEIIMDVDYNFHMLEAYEKFISTDPIVWHRAPDEIKKHLKYSPP